MPKQFICAKLHTVLGHWLILHLSQILHAIDLYKDHNKLEAKWQTSCLLPKWVILPVCKEVRVLCTMLLSPRSPGVSPGLASPASSACPLCMLAPRCVYGSRYFTRGANGNLFYLCWRSAAHLQPLMDSPLPDVVRIHYSKSKGVHGDGIVRVCSTLYAIDVPD